MVISRSYAAAGGGVERFVYFALDSVRANAAAG
jgi:hypothetical protein